ncbi:hypothetical protein H4R18_000185 [Coemansia javaensis]|uniref:Ribokinase n=1 Tax=Coemansia javaensis TaxID=2761396 RepID=A0A9W8HPB8_9FUNG|nr:hypothetical protein H4R18_000185 [Coemansia javaensis]
MPGTIVSFASINIDDVYSVPHIVRPGETISSGGVRQSAGGKGTNASVAAARAGGRVRVVGKVGADGAWVRDVIAGAGADVDQVAVVDGAATGRAIIQVDPRGENAILLLPGANHALGADDARRALAGCGPGDWLLLTNETTGVAAAISLARGRGMRVLWNPAPVGPGVVAAVRPEGLVDVLVVNEGELVALAQQLDGVDLLPEAGADRHVGIGRQVAGRLGCRVVVVTLGSAGSVGLVRRRLGGGDGVAIRMECAPVRPDQVRDTTAAGDTWVGYFAAELARLQGGSPDEGEIAPAAVERAMRVATYASGIAVTRAGAVPSIPARAEVDAFLGTSSLGAV